MMFFAFDSGWMKIGMGFVLSMIILLGTDLSTPLCQAMLNKIAFNDLIGIKALMVSVLCCVLLLSLLGAKHFSGSSLSQIKKALRWQMILRALEKSPLSLARKIPIINRLSRAMNSDVDLVAHYPQIEFKQIEAVEDYDAYVEVLKRVLDVYNKTLSDQYYRSKYYSVGGSEFLKKR